MFYILITSSGLLDRSNSNNIDDSVLFGSSSTTKLRLLSLQLAEKTYRYVIPQNEKAIKTKVPVGSFFSDRHMLRYKFVKKVMMTLSGRLHDAPRHVELPLRVVMRI